MDRNTIIQAARHDGNPGFRVLTVKSDPCAQCAMTTAMMKPLSANGSYVAVKCAACGLPQGVGRIFSGEAR